MNAIELNHVAKRYGDFALEDVNLTLPQGCVLGLEDMMLLLEKGEKAK